MVVDEARTRIDDLPHPRGVTVMLGAVCHDLGKPATTAFIDGRIRSMDHEQAGVAPARTTARPAEHPHDRRLRRPSTGRGHRRPPPQAAGVLQVRDAGGRRRVPPAGAEGRPRAARARRRIGLPREQAATSTAPGSAGSSSAPARWAWNTKRPARSSEVETFSRSACHRVRAWVPCSAKSTSSSSMDASRVLRRGSSWRVVFSDEMPRSEAPSRPPDDDRCSRGALPAARRQPSLRDQSDNRDCPLEGQIAQH